MRTIFFSRTNRKKHRLSLKRWKRNKRGSFVHLSTREVIKSGQRACIVVQLQENGEMGRGINDNRDTYGLLFKKRGRTEMKRRQDTHDNGLRSRAALLQRQRSLLAHRATVSLSLKTLGVGVALRGELFDSGIIDDANVLEKAKHSCGLFAKFGTHSKISAKFGINRIQ